MEAASIAELKKALAKLDRSELLDACLRVIRFKKDNKELLTYLLFLSHDEEAYIDNLCSEIDEQFAISPNAHKKTLRKLIRWMDKCLRFSGNKETEAQVRLYFCRTLKASRTPYRRSKVMHNMFTGQLRKVSKAIDKMHEDIKVEFLDQIKELES